MINIVLERYIPFLLKLNNVITIISSKAVKKKYSKSIGNIVFIYKWACACVSEVSG